MLTKTAIVAASVASVSYGVKMQAHTVSEAEMRAAIRNKLLEGKEKDEEGNLVTDITWSLVESVITEDMFDYICETWEYCVPDNDALNEAIGNASKAVLTSLWNWAMGSDDTAATL